MRIILRFVQRSVVFVRVPTQSEESEAQHIKSGGLQTRKLTSKLTARLLIFTSKIQKPTCLPHRVEGPADGNRLLSPECKGSTHTVWNSKLMNYRRRCLIPSGIARFSDGRDEQ